MITIVIPTIGRPSLGVLLASLARSHGPLPDRIFVVDDRPSAAEPLELGTGAERLRDRLRVIRGSSRGPAAARNSGWRAATAQWIAFLDDDVVVDVQWLNDLTADLQHCGQSVAAVQGRVEVPLPEDRHPTDWERNVAGLESARWITADCAYRRADLLAVGGFDERFPRAFREDADLALRVTARGREIVRGQRRVSHPVRPASPLVSIRLQAGNADDVLMEALHGRDWYERAGAPRGVFKNHVLITACAALSVAAGIGWLTGTLAFAAGRIMPGPRTLREIGAMLATSVVVPFAAVGYRIAGYATLGAKLAASPTLERRARAVLFDRDGTLVEDVPFNAEPSAVRLMRGASAALARLRAAGLAVGLVSNQSGIALGNVSLEQLGAVQKRLFELVGPFDTVQICPHAAADECACGKPAPGLIERAARDLGLAAADCVVIGDIGSDIAAARAAGARSILVPTSITLAEEIETAGVVAANLDEAVDLVLGAYA